MDGLPETDNVHKLSLDVTSDADIASAIATILEEQNKIDIVVNNAGMMVPGKQRLLYILMFSALHEHIHIFLRSCHRPYYRRGSANAQYKLSLRPAHV
jgi:NAD(P)-dependent dehydrogenase (short-subunit alcohol dehydrogenase family)